MATEAGEILARVHSVVPDSQRGIQHELRLPEVHEVTRVTRIVRDTLGSAAATVVERGADFLHKVVTARTAQPVSLVHGDFCPKNLLIHDGTIVGFIDWEFAGPASPAYDFAQWEVDASAPLQDRLDLVRRGYAWVADPVSAEAGLTAAFAISPPTIRRGNPCRWA